jgi:RPA family protein
LAAEKSGTQYRISGAVTNIAKAEYGNIYIKDATGEVYVYGVGAQGEFETMGVEVGDIVTLISYRGEYNGTPQAANSTLEKKEDVTAVASVTDFLALEESGAYYMVSGTVSGMAGAGEYGNIYLNDETSSIYVYGLLSGYKGAK